ncbi:MAG: asparagine synthase C-terminal domain-containing protein, partial [Pseudomonadota bacterium]|nr:asparagine synthase C-terminal domain-containing protein [Pseudomonadota bacterium]
LGYYRTGARVHDAQRRALFSPMFRTQIDGHDPSDRFADLMETASGADPLLQAQLVDLQTWLVGDILTKVDRTSMANSLETRAPFLDYELVAWGLALPQSLKLRGQEGKWILKRALEPALPREILWRRKQGFTQRLAPQFRAGASHLRARLLTGPLAESGIFRGETIARLVAEHESGRADNSMALWHLLVFEGFLAREAGITPARASLGSLPHRVDL